MNAHLIILVALAVLPSVVDAGPKRPKEAKSFHRLTEYSAADWDAQQRFGNGCSGDNGGRSLVEIVTHMARLVPAQQLLAHLQRLSILTISNVHRAFTLAAPSLRASGARTTGPPPEQVASAEALFAFLMRDAALSRMHGTSFAGIVVAAWPVVTFELLDGARGLAAVWDLIAMPVAATTDELMRVLIEAGITNMVDDCITNKRGQRDLLAYAATSSDLQRLAVFKAVAKAHWHTITLTRMFTKGSWGRAPVLLALTGLETLFAHLRVALVAARAEPFADHRALYDWLRDMLLDPDAALTLVLFMDCLCRFAELRRRLVGQLKHNDRLEAIAGSAGATSRCYVEAVLLAHLLELLYTLAALPQDPHVLGGVVIRLMVPIWTHATVVTNLTIDLPMASWIAFRQSLKGAPPRTGDVAARHWLGSWLGIGSAQHWLQRKSALKRLAGRGHRAASQAQKDNTTSTGRSPL